LAASPRPNDLAGTRRDAGVQDSLIKRIAGHEDSAVTFGVYGSRTPIKAMAEALGHLSLVGDINSTLTLKES
jgi:hypothetical protein